MIQSDTKEIADDMATEMGIINPSSGYFETFR